MFQAKISKTETVSVLKDMIKKIKKPLFDHVPASSIVLWNDSIPDDRLGERLDKLQLDDKPSLSPLARLSEVFPDLPKDRHIHILIRPPPPRE